MLKIEKITKIEVDEKVVIDKICKYLQGDVCDWIDDIIYDEFLEYEEYEEFKDTEDFKNLKKILEKMAIQEYLKILG